MNVKCETLGRLAERRSQLEMEQWGWAPSLDPTDPACPVRAHVEVLDRRVRRLGSVLFA